MTVTCWWSIPWLRGGSVCPTSLPCHIWTVFISQCCCLSLSQMKAWCIDASRTAYKRIVKVTFLEMREGECLCVCTYMCVTLFSPGIYAFAQEHVSVDRLFFAECLSWLLHLIIALCKQKYIGKIRKSQVCYFQKGDTSKAIWCCPKCSFTTNLIT